MKILLTFFFACIGFISYNAQQVSLYEISRNARFNKQIDLFNNGTDKIKYSDIQGIPYYKKEFNRAKVGEHSGTIPVRYNSFLDTIEILEKEDVYELPKDGTTPAFTFENTGEKLVYVQTDDRYSGYFFELNPGKNRILKKIITNYSPEVAAPNTLIAGTAARFDLQKPLYFVKTDTQFFELPRNAQQLAKNFPDQAKELLDFIKKNKIKFNKEDDLIQLGNFLNQ